MFAILQQVSYANLTVNNQLVSSINDGVLILLGVHKDDSLKDVEFLAKKVLKTRMFKDQDNKINLNVINANKQILVVSNFTLLADLSHGARPNFSNSADKELALSLYEAFVQQLISLGAPTVMKGAFGQHMDIDCSLNGPLNIVLDTHILNA